MLAKEQKYTTLTQATWEERPTNDNWTHHIFSSQNLQLKRQTSPGSALETSQLAEEDSMEPEFAVPDSPPVRMRQTTLSSGIHNRLGTGPTHFIHLPTYLLT
jgi:hypothetical protein